MGSVQLLNFIIDSYETFIKYKFRNCNYDASSTKLSFQKFVLIK
jgi:hypothetical protein